MILFGWVDQCLLRSPQLAGRAMKNQSRTIHILQMKVTCNRDTITRLRATEEVIPNINAGVLLEDEKQWKADYAAMTSRKIEISKKISLPVSFKKWRL